MHGNLEVLRFLMANGCPWKSKGSVISSAKRAQAYDVVAWANEQADTPPPVRVGGMVFDPSMLYEVKFE